MRPWMTGLLHLCAAALVIAAGPVAAQQTSPRGELANPAQRRGPVVTVVPSEPAAQAIAPSAPATANTQRVFVDTTVSDVRVGNDMTVATMAQSPQSECASNQYVFERNRAKWLYETGRLLVAMKEGAVLRVSFTCLDGRQSINAIQFLSPPTSAVASGTPRPGNVVRLGG